MLAVKSHHERGCVEKAHPGGFAFPDLADGWEAVTEGMNPGSYCLRDFISSRCPNPLEAFSDVHSSKGIDIDRHAFGVGPEELVEPVDARRTAPTGSGTVLKYQRVRLQMVNETLGDLEGSRVLVRSPDILYAPING